MTDKIKLLPDTVANQIAAGEVVNRPASVVKEMVENAVDAGAKNITVSYRNGGKEVIRISDDGEGMSPQDARMAFDKHATSKISSLDDVYALRTFGFRGEALASIAAIASVELVTRRADSELGVELVMEGGRLRSQSETVAPVGSTFTVKNLFYNVPARRRALERSTTEPRHIAEEFKRVAMCHPETAFALYGEDAPIYNLQPSGLKQRIVGLVGRSCINNLLETSTNTSLVRLTGYVGKPSLSRQTNRDQYLFVNGRYFKNPYFHKAVMQAYEKLIQTGTQPSYFLFLEVEPDKVDVNIHPQKIEVNFEDGPAIWQIVHAAVREALARTGTVSFMDFDPECNIEIPVRRMDDVPPREPDSALDETYDPFRRRPSGVRADLSDFTEKDRGTLASLGRDDALARFDSSVLEYIEAGEEQQDLPLAEGEQSPSSVLPLPGGYVALRMGGDLAVIDLRRAKEAILYERYRLMLGHESSMSQRLLFPQTIAFSSDDTALLRERADDFAAMGFEYVVADDNRVEVSGIPADFAPEQIQDMLYDLIDALREESLVGEFRCERLAAVLARDGARTTPRSFTDGEIRAIVDTVSGGGPYARTPDGRPVMCRLSPDMIGRLFREADGA